MDFETVDDDTLKFYIALVVPEAVVISRNRPPPEWNDCGAEREDGTDPVAEYLAQVNEKMDDPVWFWQKRYQEKCKEMDMMALEMEVLQKSANEAGKIKEGENRGDELVCGEEASPKKHLEKLDVDMLVKAVVQKLQTDVENNVNENIYNFMSTLRQWVRLEDLDAAHVVEITQQIKRCYKHITTQKARGWFKTAQSVVDQVMDLYYSYFCAIYGVQLKEGNTNKEYKRKKRVLVKDAMFTLVFLGAETIMVRYYVIESLCKFLSAQSILTHRPEKLEEEGGNKQRQRVEQAVLYRFLDKIVSGAMMRLVSSERSSELFVGEYTRLERDLREGGESLKAGAQLEEAVRGMELRKEGLRAVRSQTIKSILWHMDDLQLQAKFLDMKWVILD